MYKLLIVDDFFFDREHAATIINWAEFGIEMIGSAESGAIAKEIISSNKPDILLTDIKMPDIDGVELTRHVLTEYPGIKVVFMSYSNEFKYARDAIQLDVVDYITKPLLKDEVSEVIRKVVARLDMEIADNRERQELKIRLQESFPLLRERFLRNFLTGMKNTEENFRVQIEYLGIDIQNGMYQLVVFEIDGYDQLHDMESLDNSQLLGLRISDAIARGEELTHGINRILIQTDEYRFAVFISSPKSVTVYELEQASLMLAQNALVMINGASGGSVSAIVGDVFYVLNETARHYFRCIDAARYKFYVGQGGLIRTKDVPEEYGYLAINFNQLKQDLKNMLFAESNDAVTHIIDLYINGIRFPSENSVKNIAYSVVIYLQLTLLELGINCKDIFGGDLFIWDKLIHTNTIQDIQQWLYLVFIQTRKYLSNKSRKHANKIVKSIQKYVADNLNKEITIQQIAEEIYLSPNYANLLFKNETGETIPEYIARQRVEKAKLLLIDPQLKLYEITEMVGYNHLAYFNGLFKKYTGMTMKEYRNVR